MSMHNAAPVAVVASLLPAARQSTQAHQAGPAADAGSRLCRRRRRRRRGLAAGTWKQEAGDRSRVVPLAAARTVRRCCPRRHQTAPAHRGPISDVCIEVLQCCNTATYNLPAYCKQEVSILACDAASETLLRRGVLVLLASACSTCLVQQCLGALSFTGQSDKECSC